MRIKIYIFAGLLSSLLIACNDKSDEVTLEQQEEITLNVTIPEIELVRGILPVTVSISGADSTSILLDGQQIFESAESEYEYELNTEDYTDGVYALTVLAANSEEVKFEQEIEIFNKLMTYELLDEELDQSTAENRWRIIVLTTLDGEFLDYKIMESAGIYEFGRPEDFEGDEFMFYFFQKRSRPSPFSSTLLLGNAFDTKIGKWGTTLPPNDSSTTPSTREVTFQLRGFENESSTDLSLVSREDGFISYKNVASLPDSTGWNIPNFPEDFSHLDAFLCTYGNNAADLFHTEISNDQVHSTTFELTRNDFSLVQPDAVVALPENTDYRYNASVLIRNTKSQIFRFSSRSATKTLKSYDLSNYFDNYEHDLDISLNDENNSTLAYTFKNENIPSQLPSINFTIENVKAQPDAISFEVSGEEGLITVAYLNFIDRETRVRLFYDKKYNNTIGVKIPAFPQEILDFEPLFAEYANNTVVGVTIRNEPIYDTPFKLFQSQHGRTTEPTFTFSDTRALSIDVPFN